MNEDMKIHMSTSGFLLIYFYKVDRLEKVMLLSIFFKSNNYLKDIIELYGK